MKRLLLLSVFLFFFVKTNAQNGRWMYLLTNQGVTLMVDTLKNDTKQFDNYEAHDHVVLIWVKTVQKRSTKKGSFIESALVHYAVDTTTNQIEIKSGALYHNNTPIPSENYNYFTWEDVIPESGGDILIAYCRAVNNQPLMQKFILNASLHDRKAAPQK
jgi:hypothetical protein